MSGVVGVVSLAMVMSGMVVAGWVVMKGVGASVDWSIGTLGSDVGGLGVSFGGFTYGMSLVVWLVFVVVLGFSMYYMAGAGGSASFGWLVLSFVVGVQVLLLGSGLYTLFLGWEVLGVVSFLLIGYYCTRSSWGGALFTLLINRVGDIGGVFMFVVMLGVMWGAEMGEVGVGVVVGVLLMMCMVTKSAQVPLGGWLPLAMAAPTPVSALVHSSTLVIAGLCVGWFFSVYLGEWSSWLLWVGVGTLVGAALSASGEADLKKVVAFSTTMHLGLMVVMAVVVGWWFMGVHMSLHAFYKSLLFIGVGCVILVMVHDQDFRGFVVGGRVMSSLGVVVLSSIWSLVGLVYFSGWVTKDSLMEVAGSSTMGWGVWAMIILGLAGSGVYSFKLLFGMGSQSAGKTGVVGEWEIGMSWVWLAVLMVSVLSSLGGIVWSLWGDRGVEALVVSGEEKGAYWVMLSVLVVGWLVLGSSIGVGLLVGLEKVLSGVGSSQGYGAGMENLWLEVVWLGGAVSAVVEGVVGMGELAVSGLVHFDWYVVVMVMLVGLCFVVIG
uniref:NADH:ubiquinone reductase (H(+)-translocating) n=1 Tax=Centrorhynchus aluconis TaxID=1795424 RepID=A0A140DJ66_9BILA|nr:NADH dehydrogenase subunit 5 [Centrorhynchus aluconis]